MNLRVKIKRLSEHAVIPQYAREGDVGFDLVASEDVIIEPGATVIVPTGIAISLPPGYEAQIRPRSGITVKTKLRVQLGTIDSGYIGEIGVIVDNIAVRKTQYASDYAIEYKHVDGTTSSVPSFKCEDKWQGDYSAFERVPNGTFLIRKGDRIAQGVIKPVERAHFVEVAELEDTQRGGKGFGSSGVKTEKAKQEESE